MYSCKHFTITAIVLIAIVLSGCVVHSNNFEFPTCEGQSCGITAIKKILPPHSEDGQYTIDLDQFSFILPSPPLRIYRLLGGDIYVYFEKGSSLSFSLETQKSLSEDTPWPSISNYSVADSAEFIFTKTGNDLAAIMDKNDLWIMRRALFLKGELFPAHSEISYSNKSDFSLYYWNDTSMTNVCFAYIFSKRIRDKYVRISSNNMPYAAFQSIVASIKTTDHFRIRRGDK